MEKKRKLKRKKKKLLFVINTLGRGGAERALLELLKRMDPGGYDIYLYVLLEQGNLAKELPGYVRLLNRKYLTEDVLGKNGAVQLRRTVLRCFFRNGQAGKKIADMISSLLEMVKGHHFRMDKLLWRTVSDGAYRFSKTFDLAVAYLEGGSTYYVAEHVKAKKKAAFVHIAYDHAGYTRRMDQNCYAAYDKIFCVSDEVREHYLNVYPEYKDKTCVFHNFIDRDRILGLSQEPGGFADSFDGIRILTVGRLTYQKAYDIAIRALRLLIDHGWKVRWYVLGEGDLREALTRQIQALELEKDFLLLGTVDNPYPYYKGCDLYVHASRYEGKSIAIQEAQILGCPIIATDCSGNREQISHGKDGLLCGLSPKELARCIGRLCRDEALRTQLGKAAADKMNSGDAKLGKLLDLIL